MGLGTNVSPLARISRCWVVSKLLDKLITVLEVGSRFWPSRCISLKILGVLASEKVTRQLCPASNGVLNDQHGSMLIEVLE